VSEPNEPAEPRSVRLIFEYVGDQVSLVSQQPVDVAITGFDVPQEAMPGYHVEVRGANEQVLSRVPIRAEMTASREVFPETPGEPIVRVDLPEARGAFTVVVPAPVDAHHVTVVRITGRPTGVATKATAPPAESRAQVTELGSFALDGGAR